MLSVTSPTYNPSCPSSSLLTLHAVFAQARIPGLIIAAYESILLWQVRSIKCLECPKHLLALRCVLVWPEMPHAMRCTGINSQLRRIATREPSHVHEHGILE